MRSPSGRTPYRLRRLCRARSDAAPAQASRTPRPGVRGRSSSRAWRVRKVAGRSLRLSGINPKAGYSRLQPAQAASATSRHQRPAHRSQPHGPRHSHRIAPHDLEIDTLLGVANDTQEGVITEPRSDQANGAAGAVRGAARRFWFETKGRLHCDDRYRDIEMTPGDRPRARDHSRIAPGSLPVHATGCWMAPATSADDSRRSSTRTRSLPL